MTKRIPYQIAVVGASGKGKTMAFRNMNPNTCAFINMEGKPLPFENKFKHYFVPQTWQECYQTIIKCAQDETITEVVLDSFSAYFDSLLKTARETKKGSTTVRAFKNLFNCRKAFRARTTTELFEKMDSNVKKCSRLRNPQRRFYVYYSIYE